MIDRSHFLWEITYRLSGHVGHSLDKKGSLSTFGGGGSDRFASVHAPFPLMHKSGRGGPGAHGKNLTTVRPLSVRREAHENDRLTGGCFWSRRTDTALPPNKAPKNEAQPLFPTLKQKVSTLFQFEHCWFLFVRFRDPF